jgi:hypothetical protein
VRFAVYIRANVNSARSSQIEVSITARRNTPSECRCPNRSVCAAVRFEEYPRTRVNAALASQTEALTIRTAQHTFRESLRQNTPLLSEIRRCPIGVLRGRTNANHVL